MHIGTAPYNAEALRLRGLARAGTPGPGSPVALTCLNDAVNEHVGAV